MSPETASAYPGYFDGVTLKSYLESARRAHAGKAYGEDARRAQFVYGYIVGIVDALNNDTAGHFFCQPLSITKERDAEIVLQYMDANPAVLSIMVGSNATLYVFDALGDAFPCKKR